MLGVRFDFCPFDNGWVSYMQAIAHLTTHYLDTNLVVGFAAAHDHLRHTLDAETSTNVSVPGQR